MATFAPEATKRSAIARPKPWAPPVTTAQRPFRSILFIALILYFKRPASKRPAAIDDMGDAGSERALVAGEVDGEGCNFFGRAEPSHRLAADEHFAPLRTSRGGAVQHRWGFDGQDRKSTRLNSSHTVISYAVFCLKKKITRLREASVAPFI